MLHKPWACGVGQCPPAMFLASKRSSSLVAKVGVQSKLKTNEISMRVRNKWVGEKFRFMSHYFNYMSCLVPFPAQHPIRNPAPDSLLISVHHHFILAPYVWFYHSFGLCTMALWLLILLSPLNCEVLFRFFCATGPSHSVPSLPQITENLYDAGIVCLPVS